MNLNLFLQSICSGSFEIIHELVVQENQLLVREQMEFLMGVWFQLYFALVGQMALKT
jgi:hypothetical protein